MILTLFRLYMAYTLELILLCNGGRIRSTSMVDDMFVRRYMQESISLAKSFA